jgi:hypothetical protein
MILSESFGPGLGFRVLVEKYGAGLRAAAGGVGFLIGLFVLLFGRVDLGFRYSVRTIFVVLAL